MRSPGPWPTVTPGPRKPWTPVPPAPCSTAGSRSATASTRRAVLTPGGQPPGDPRFGGLPAPEPPGRSGAVGQAQGEGGLQVVPGVGAEGDMGLGVRDPGNLVQPPGDDVG